MKGGGFMNMDTASHETIFPENLVQFMLIKGNFREDYLHRKHHAAVWHQQMNENP